MIKPEKIDEWIHEAEERPSSASIIIRFIGNRLIDLAKWNEELRAENLALRTGHKIEEYESRIATLEYQIGLLKRQLGGEVVFPDPSIQVKSSAATDLQSLNLMIYHPQGQVLRIEIPLSILASDSKVGQFSGEVTSAILPLRILAVSGAEELLFAFDSGRTVNMPVPAILPSDQNQLHWQQAFLQPPLGSEELAFIQTVGRMALYELCIQVSRKGCVKRIKESLFETYMAKSYIGTGIKSTPDKTCELILCGKNDRLVLVSKEGYLQCLDVDSLPSTIEEVVRLSVTDHIINAFVVGPGDTSESFLLFIAQNGKVIQRETSWLDTASSYKTRGQPVFSQERREAGIRLIGAALARYDDWGISLRSDGGLFIHSVRDFVESGNLLSRETGMSILGFTIYNSRL